MTPMNSSSLFICIHMGGMILLRPHLLNRQLAFDKVSGKCGLKVDILNSSNNNKLQA